MYLELIIDKIKHRQHIARTNPESAIDNIEHRQHIARIYHRQNRTKTTYS